MTPERSARNAREGQCNEGLADFVRQARAVVDLFGAERGGVHYLVSTDPALAHGTDLIERGHSEELDAFERGLHFLDAGSAQLSRNGAIVDLGAGIGLVTVAALAAHGFERAIACEPDLDKFSLIRGNLILNGVEARARVLPVAVTRPGAAGEAPRETVTLDYLVERGIIDVARVALIRVETPDLAATLEGAASLLESGAPLLLRRDGASVPDTAFAQLRRHGYDVRESSDGHSPWACLT